MVREQSAKACYLIAKSFSTNPNLISAFMERVKAFKQSRKYTMRQTFLVMCESFISGDPDDQSPEANLLSEQIFKAHFLPSFVELQSDKIINVRLQVSLVLG